MGIVANIKGPQGDPGPQGPPGPSGVDQKDLPCDSSVDIGDWVRVNASNIVVKAQADNKANAQVAGLVEAKVSSVIATVRFTGPSSLIFTDLDPTKEYILSALVAGAMTPRGDPTPSDTGNVVIPVGRPLDETTFLIHVGEIVVRS